MRRIIPLVVLLAAAGCNKQPAAAPQASPENATQAAAPAAPAPITKQADRSHAGKAGPKTELSDLATGTKVTLADYKGKPLLVNLWATWCVPCVKELPTLDALAKRDGGRLKVLAVSEDMDGARVVKPFLAARKIATLGPVHDNDNGLMLALNEGGLPVTILYGADGKEVWRYTGDMDWTSAKAKALLAEAGA